MQFKHIVKSIMLVTVIVGLTACSSFGKKDMSAGSASMMNGSETAGLGSENGFGYMNSGHAVGGQNQSFYFDFDQSSVNSADLSNLQIHANYLVSHPNEVVRLEGNTDNRGSPEYNVGLGWHRADAVAKVLQMDGVPKTQVKEVSYGEERPVALGTTEADYAQNRRVDLVYENSK